MLWHPPGIPLPQELLRILERRRVSVVSCRSSFGALAELVRLARTGRAQGAPPLLLLVMEPERLPDAVELVDLARRYAPRAVRWWYSERAEPRLSELTDAVVAGWADARTGPAAPAPSPVRTNGTPGGSVRGGGPVPAPAAPTLRLTEPVLAADRPPGPESSHPVLTSEELAMLLADQEGDAPGSIGGGGRA